MAVDMNKQMQDQIEQAVAPARQFQATLLDYAEKMANFQLETAQNYTEATLNNFRELIAVDSPERAQSFLQNATKSAQEFSDKVARDGQKLAELSQAAGEDVRRITEENVTAATKNVQDAAGKAGGTSKKPIK